jgi:hypothetical protein
MHYLYKTMNYVCSHDFTDDDEIIFSIFLVAISKVTRTKSRAAEIALAVRCFRDEGQSVTDILYQSIRSDPADGTVIEIALVGDPVEVIVDQGASILSRMEQQKRKEERRKATVSRRRGLWNAVLAELRFRDRIDDDVNGGATDEIANDLPSRRHLRDLIRRAIAPDLRERLEIALTRSIITPEVLKKMAELPLGEDHDFPDIEFERDQFRLLFFPELLGKMPTDHLDYRGFDINRY